MKEWGEDRREISPKETFRALNPRNLQLRKLSLVHDPVLGFLGKANCLASSSLPDAPAGSPTQCAGQPEPAQKPPPHSVSLAP